MKKPADFNKVFPLYKVENDSIISKQGDVTVAMKCTLPEIFTMSEADFESFHHVWLKALKALCAGTVFHKQDWFFQRRHSVDRYLAEQSFLSRASEIFFNERPFLEHKAYIMITKKASNRRPMNSSLTNMFRCDVVPGEFKDANALEDFFDSVAQFERIVNDSGMARLEKMSASELTGANTSVGLLEQYCFLKTDEASTMIADIHCKNELRIGSNICNIFSLGQAQDMPSMCASRINYDRYSSDNTKFSIGFATSVCQLLHCNHVYNQMIFLDDVRHVIKTLEGKRLRLQSLSAYSRENTIARDATNDFLNEAIGMQRIPVRSHFNLITWSSDQKELHEQKSMVSSAFSQMDIIIKQETDNAAQLFWSCLPGNEADFPRCDTFDIFAEQATCMLNLETSYQSSLSAFGIRLGDRLTGKPVHVDISDEPVKKGICTNRNKFILGPSGSGKSFFTNHMVRSYYEQGTHIVLVDVGHSYKGLCQLVNGYYFTYEENNPICFNPFFIPDGEILDTEKKESIKTLLLALWKKDSDAFNRSEYVALSVALQMYYKLLKTKPEIFPCFNSFYEFLRDVFVEELKADNVKEKDFDIENFLYVLKPYYRKGEFDYLLNAETNLELLKERFIVFELDNIKDHPILFPVVTIIIMEVFISKMRKLKGVRKMILIEEAWKAIAKEGMAEYIKYLFKTVRKFYGEAIVVTQEVEDIISSPVVKQAIINNSDCKILLDQSKYQNKFDQIQQLLGLTDKEKALVLSINKSNDPRRKYKEVFISLAGVVSKVYATEVSPEEYLLYTTEESEKLQVQKYIVKWNGDIKAAIRELALDLKVTHP